MTNERDGDGCRDSQTTTTNKKLTFASVFEIEKSEKVTALHQYCLIARSIENNCRLMCEGRRRFSCRLPLLEGVQVCKTGNKL